MMQSSNAIWCMLDIPSIVSKAFDSRFKQRQRSSGKPNTKPRENQDSRQEKSDTSQTTVVYEINADDLQALNSVIESLNLTIASDTEQPDKAQLRELSSGKLIKTVSADYVAHLCTRLRTDGADYFYASGFLLSETV